MDDPSGSAPLRTRKKPSYPIGEDLRSYLRKYRRERELPVTYERGDLTGSGLGGLLPKSRW